MPDTIRVMVQVKATPAVAAAAFGPVPASPRLAISQSHGVLFDATYSPVPVPPPPQAVAGAGFGRMAFATAFSSSQPAGTYVMRAAVHSEELDGFLRAANNDPDVVAVFADPRMQPLAICPNGLYLQLHPEKPASF